MKDALKQLYWKIIADRTQEKMIYDFLRRAGASSESRVLDVGCGYGRNLKALKKRGLSPVGCDINPEALKADRSEGFTCYSPDDPALAATRWDVILMSHIIEHFDYKSLFEFMEKYLSYLRPNGFLIIASPLPNKRFYDNFDHVKPYTPAAIEEVFGRRGLQVQFQSVHELELLELWIRRRPYPLGHFASTLRRDVTLKKALIKGMHIFLKLLFLASLRLFGVADGWVALYRKL